METPVLVGDATTIITGNKRVPKACGSCRQSKVKCDGKRPCTRCSNLKKPCLFAQRAKDPTEQKIEDLERQIEALKDRLDGQQPLPNNDGNELARDIPPDQITGQISMTEPSQFSTASHMAGSTPSSSPALFEAPRSRSVNHMIPSGPDGIHYATSQSSSTKLTFHDDIGRRNKRARLEPLMRTPVDFISKRLVTTEQARSYFTTFFNGCDRFVPVFDPEYDTFDSVRLRSALLFNTICTIGCRVERGFHNSRALNFELRKLLDVLIVNRKEHSLETVQALLVIACYSPERSLILSFATRMAFDLGLPGAYEELPRQLITDGTHATRAEITGWQEALLMRQARTWLFLLVLENGFQIDAGKIPIVTSRSGARRCRVLLNKPFSTVLDLRLFSQMELHVMRVDLYKKLDECTGIEDVELMEMVKDAMIDLDIWSKDWQGITKSSPVAGAETPVLLRNIQVQRYWVESMTYFKAVQLIGVENIAAMSSSGHSMLSMARNALRNHLRTILEAPDEYLVHFKYASDFVWAKGAFCFLLLLKLDRLLPESGESSAHLLQDGNKLLTELNSVGAGPGNNTSRLALQVLRLSIDKYNRALREHQVELGDFCQQETTCSWGSDDAQTDLQGFVPEEFVFEWECPGLTLFSSLIPWLNPFADDFMLGISMYD